MSLNPNAKPFVFNAGAAAFVPGGAAAAAPAPAPVAAAAPPVAAAPAPAPAPAPTPAVAPTASAPVAASTAPAAYTTAAEPSAAATAAATSAAARSAADADAAARAASGLEFLEKGDGPSAAAEASSAAGATAGAVDDADEAEIAEAEAEEAAAAAAAAASGGPSRLMKHINVVFIGHVDAGKSTLSGQILYLTGQLDDRTLEKFEREAAQTGQASFKFAWALDSTEQERVRGKTQEIGRGYFCTASKQWTILDAPGHRAFIPHMIGGASQADIAVLVISAHTGEFETGWDVGGQSREHAILAKTAGVRQLIVAVNKMDDVEWSKARYDEIEGTVAPFLKSVGFSKAETTFIPVAGLRGLNILAPLPAGLCDWYTGLPLLGILDALKPPQRLLDAAFRLPVADVYSDMGVVIMGKLESGVVNTGDRLRLMPNGTDVEVTGMWIDKFPVTRGEPGDNLRVKLRGVEETDVRVGFVLCSPTNLVPSVTEFEAQLMVLESKTIICAGYLAVMHIHAAIEEVRIHKIISVIDRKTNEVLQAHPRFIKEGQTVIIRFKTDRPVCLQRYKDFAQLGRFMLRDEGRTIGVGVITKVKDPKEGKAGKA